MPNASSENCPLIKYIPARPNSVPNATGSTSRGTVSQLRKHTEMNTNTSSRETMTVPVRSPLMREAL